MDRKIKAPTKAEFLSLFNDLRSQAVYSGAWRKYGDMWFDLYRRSWLTGRRRAKFSTHQERYLAAIGFDEQDPILDPEAAKYKNLLAGSPDVARARRFILIERMLRGLAVREGGREGSTYVLAAKGRRTAFAEQSLKKKQSGYSISLEMTVSNPADPWNRLVINRKERRIVVVVNDMRSFQTHWGWDANAVRNLVEDPSSPEYGYAFEVIRLIGPIDEYDYMKRVYADAQFYSGVPQMRTILAGAGQAANREFSRAWADRDRMADYVRGRGIEWSCDASWGLEPVAKNDPKILHKPLREQELERYATHGERLKAKGEPVKRKPKQRAA